ncbi:hypothetical protein E4K72_09235 [Oxalobacteraceae bacterium OM1]|nr:hypothetical protein E4K72_09235 [Oxalobacteraceae bacterium OM1]
MSIFAKPVFDATVVFEGQELFKGQGAARQWAEQVAREIEAPVEVRKIGTGWALFAVQDGQEVRWGVFGQRLKRME